MGACTFTAYQAGTDPNEAMRAAVENARYEKGHGGYTGTIAEKYDFVKITDTVMTENQAYDCAYKLLNENDPRISDKWGPAGAIPVKVDTREIIVTNVPGGLLDDKQALMERVLAQARKQRKIRRGETAVTAHLQVYRMPNLSTRGYSRNQARYLDGATAVLTVRRGSTTLARLTEPDGWLFFGWASS